MKKLAQLFCFGYLICLITGCANVVPPSGGPKDVTPPKLVQISPADSQLNIRVTTLKLNFDEYITLNNPAQQIQLSPLISVPIDVSLKRKTVTVKIPDSLLQENTTYQLSFGNAIQDLHEGNSFSEYSYLFSTGSFFDSLTLEGRVFDAATGLPDSASFVLLYDVKAGDSAILRQKPSYVTHVNGAGNFQFKGLPQRDFQIFALRDQNSNLIFDGSSEGIAFYPAPVTPLPDSTFQIGLYVFQTTTADTNTTKEAVGTGSRRPLATQVSKATAQGYQVMVDTANIQKRSFDVTKSLKVQLLQKPKEVHPERLFLTYDSAGITTESPVTVTTDSFNRILIVASWRQDAVYELRFQKGFATDSAGSDLLPGVYRFRTKRKEDYASMRLHLPGKYYDSSYILEIYGPSEKELFYREKVTDTNLQWQLMMPGSYNIRIIHDENRNGVWDSGTLFPKKQPESVIPYPSNPVKLREGWENEIDFEKR